MALAPLALGAGARLGTAGLRQNDRIIIPVQNIEFINTLQIYFYSPSGEVISILSAGRDEGMKLEIEWTENKSGGLSTFTLRLIKENEIPFFNGMLVRFFVYNLPWALGYLKGIPDTDTDSEVIELSGLGYSEKLKDITITEDYQTKSPIEIIENISSYFPDIDIIYNSSKIILPNISIGRVSFNDRSLYDALLTLTDIFNYQFESIQYIFGVDEYQEFYFYGIENKNIKKHYLEGYDYQSPEVEKSGEKLVNQILVYRAQQANLKETEFVATYKDQNSIDNNGLFERKITVSDFISDTEAQKIAEAIIEEQKEPKKRITLNNLEPDRRLEWGFYALSNRRSFQKNLISEFNDLSEWDQSLTTSTISLTRERVFTGRNCFKWELDNSSGDKISLSFDRIYGPNKAVIYLRHSEKIEALKISFTGLQGKVIGQTIINTGGPFITSGGNVVAIPYKVYPEPYAKNLDNLFINDWIPFEFEFNNIFYIETVEIEAITSSAVTILLDRLDIFSNSYKYNNLVLENIAYTYNGVNLKAAATFGNEVINIINELTEINKINQVAFNIFSKQ